MWPMVLLFPEFGQSDNIERAPEGMPLSEQLDEIYGPGCPPIPWDTRGEYTRERLRLYYLSNAAKPLQLDKLTEVFLCFLALFWSSIQSHTLQMRCCSILLDCP